MGSRGETTAWAWSLAVLLASFGGCASHRQESTDRPGARPEVRIGDVESGALRDAIHEAMTDARRAVDAHGVTEPAIERIRIALGRLSREPGLADVTLRELHGGGVSVAMLGTEGDLGLTLTLARFAPGVQTAAHDHGSWAVAYVVKGRDRYVHWERVDDGSSHQHAELRVAFERVLGPGDSVHWLDPPHDIHSQMAIDEAAWELVLFGKNPLRSERQYFDVDSGSVTTRSPR